MGTLDLMLQSLFAVDDRRHDHDLHDHSHGEDDVEYAVVVVQGFLVRLARHARWHHLCVM